MKEAHIFKGPRVEVHDVSVPSPGPDEVLTKVVVSGSNPKDWKMPHFMPTAEGTNQGDDIAGTVAAVGENVTEFKPGDRVAGFHRITSPNGSWAEYAISPAHTTFHLPKQTSFEEAATIPLAAGTAAVGLFVRLGLPEPWLSTEEKLKAIGADGGLIIYGGASAVGAFAIKLAKESNIHPIIAVAGRGIPYVESLLDKSKGDTVVDYRNGDEAVVKGLQAAIPQGKTLNYAFDAVSEHNSFINISKVLNQDGGNISLVLPGMDFSAIPKGINQTTTQVGNVHNAETIRPFGLAWYRLFGQGLKEGWFSGHPYEVVTGGLAGVETAMKNLSEGKASAVKYVFRIADTEGAGKDQVKL
ncbi:MAG: hypothetical protein Q9160_006126 [Pyrenula sp. 1 TL-2023]